MVSLCEASQPNLCTHLSPTFLRSSINLIIFHEGYKLWNSLLSIFCQFSVTSCPLGPNITLSTLCDPSIHVLHSTWTNFPTHITQHCSYSFAYYNLRVAGWQKEGQGVLNCTPPDVICSYLIRKLNFHFFNPVFEYVYFCYIFKASSPHIIKIG
jgi:hypothetical protein